MSMTEMVDMADHIAAKSDQLNADDLMGGPVEWTVESVRASGDADQPIEIMLREWPQPWKPCKTMRRLMVHMWGRDAKAYVGRRLRLWRDPDVVWGGMKVGGIRIAAMSDIDGGSEVMLTEKRGRKRKFTVTALTGASREAQGSGGGDGQTSQPPPPAFTRNEMGGLHSALPRMDDMSDGHRRELFKIVKAGLEDDGMERADRLRRFVEHERGICMEAGIPPTGMEQLARIAEGLK